MSIYDIKVEIAQLNKKYFPPILELKTTIINNIKKKLPILLFYAVSLHSTSYHFPYWLKISPPSGEKVYNHRLMLEEVLFRKVIEDIGGHDTLFINVRGTLTPLGGSDITNHSDAIELDKENWILAQNDKNKRSGRGIKVSSAYEQMMKHKIKEPLEELQQENKIPRFLRLHPKIISASEKLFRDRHYSQAIFEAVKVLEKEIKTKSKIKDKIGVDLVNHVFNKEHPIIKIVEGDEAEQIDEREGFRFLYMGTFLGIKNPKSHSPQHLNDSAKALEYLAFLSLLMKRLDEAV